MQPPKNLPLILEEGKRFWSEQDKTHELPSPRNRVRMDKSRRKGACRAPHGRATRLRQMSHSNQYSAALYADGAPVAPARVAAP